MHFGLEVIVLPVSDIDRAKSFYEQMGWHLDVDQDMGETFRVVQFTPPGSACSVTFGRGMPVRAEPGSMTGMHLVVSDIVAAVTELERRGIEVSDIWHFGDDGQTVGPHPDRADHGSYATIDDPDGNTWLLQEVPSRAE